MLFLARISAVFVSARCLNERGLDLRVMNNKNSML